MTKLIEQDIINAICMYIAERKQIKPNEVNVQLAWDEEHGFHAEVSAQGRSQFLIQANMLEAIEYYMLKRFSLRVYTSDIELDIEDEMIANIRHE